MKLNKKIFAGALAGLIAVSSIAVAANERRNLTAYYNIKLNVNGNVFTTTDSTMRPFATSDGRTYISIAGLREAGLVSVAYDNATKTVSVKGADANAAGSAALQAQVASQAAEIARLQYENTQLKAEVEKTQRHFFKLIQLDQHRNKITVRPQLIGSKNTCKRHSIRYPFATCRYKI